jgi:hypothetical protein
MRSQIDAISTKLAEGAYYMASVTKKDSSGEQPEAVVKELYKAPSFRFESVFEVTALSCGKISATQGPCHSNSKVS